jgi:hypothetical protein
MPFFLFFCLVSVIGYLAVVANTNNREMNSSLTIPASSSSEVLPRKLIDRKEVGYTQLFGVYP